MNMDQSFDILPRGNISSSQNPDIRCNSPLSSLILDLSPQLGSSSLESSRSTNKLSVSTTSLHNNNDEPESHKFSLSSGTLANKSPFTPPSSSLNSNITSSPFNYLHNQNNFKHLSKSLGVRDKGLIPSPSWKNLYDKGIEKGIKLATKSNDEYLGEKVQEAYQSGLNDGKKLTSDEDLESTKLLKLEYDNQINQLKSKVNDLNQESILLNKTIEDMTDNEKKIREKLNNENQEFRTEINRYKNIENERNDLTKKYESSLESIQNLTTRNNDLQNQYNDSKIKINDLQSQVTQSIQRISDLQNDVIESKNQITHTDKEVDDLQKKYDNSKKEVDDLRFQLKTSNCQLDDLQNKYNDSKKQIINLQNEVNQHNKANKEINEQIIYYKNQVNTIQGQLVDSEKNNQKLIVENQNESSQHKVIVREWKDKCSNLRNEIEQITISSYENGYRQGNEEFTNNKKEEIELAYSNGFHAGKNDSDSVQINKISDLNNNFEEMCIKHNKSSNENIQLNLQISNLKTELNDSRNNITKLKEEHVTTINQMQINFDKERERLKTMIDRIANEKNNSPLVRQNIIDSTLKDSPLPPSSSSSSLTSGISTPISNTNRPQKSSNDLDEKSVNSALSDFSLNNANESQRSIGKLLTKAIPDDVDIGAEVLYIERKENDSGRKVTETVPAIIKKISRTLVLKIPKNAQHGDNLVVETSNGPINVNFNPGSKISLGDVLLAIPKNAVSGKTIVWDDMGDIGVKRYEILLTSTQRVVQVRSKYLRMPIITSNNISEF